MGLRAKWLDRDGGGGGYVGWAFRQRLREAAMRQFIEGHLAVTGTPPVEVKPLPTDRARSLPGLWHGDPSSSPRPDTSPAVRL